SRRAAVLAGIVLGVVSIFRHDLFVYFFAAIGGVLVAVAVARKRGSWPVLGEVKPAALFWPLIVGAGTAVVLWLPVIFIGSLRNVWRDLVYNVYVYIMPARALPFPNL